MGNSPWGHKEQDTTEQPITQWFRTSKWRKEMEMSICKCLASECFLSHAVTERCREEFYQTLLDSSLSTCLVYTIVIMVVLPSWNRPANVVWQLGKGQRFFLILLDLDCFQLKINSMPKRHFGVVNYDLHWTYNDADSSTSLLISSSLSFLTRVKAL